MRRYFLQVAQLPAKERNENASTMSQMWSRGFVRLPSLRFMRWKKAKTMALSQKQKSKEKFWTCFGRAKGLLLLLYQKFFQLEIYTP